MFQQALIVHNHINDLNEIMTGITSHSSELSLKIVSDYFSTHNVYTGL